MRTVLLIFLALGASAQDGERRKIEKWRAEYEAGLKAPEGWLSVAGLFWLHEGDNTVGSDARSDVVLPPGGQGRAGVLKFHAGSVTFEGRVLKADSADEAKFGDVSLTIIARGGKTGARLRDPHAATVRNFTGCIWYPIEDKYRVAAKWVAYPEPKKMAITNILGMTMQEDVPGRAEFVLNGRELRLEPVVEDGQLFFMFRDGTSGNTTYGAGRFLYASMPKDGLVELDFNKAKNPPCAFTAYATCPLPAKQNTLPVAVTAGEKKYGRH